MQANEEPCHCDTILLSVVGLRVIVWYRVEKGEDLCLHTLPPTGLHHVDIESILKQHTSKKFSAEF